MKGDKDMMLKSVEIANMMCEEFTDIALNGRLEGLTERERTVAAHTIMVLAAEHRTGTEQILGKDV